MFGSLPKFVWAFLSLRDVTARFAHQLGECMRMFRNHSAGWVSDRWPPFCRKLLAGLALIASGTLFVEFVEPFPDTWSSSWKQIGASIPVLTQDWDTNGSMKSFISRSIEWTQQNDRILILIYSYSLSSIFRAKSVYLSCFIFFSRHSQVAVPTASSNSSFQRAQWTGRKSRNTWPPGCSLEHWNWV